MSCLEVQVVLKGILNALPDHLILRPGQRVVRLLALSEHYDIVGIALSSKTD